jgi:hypothetical protein
VNRVLFVEPARLEVLAEVAYYRRIEAGLGTRFLEAVEDATARALAYPLAGTTAQNRTRRVFLRDFPFALVYRSDEHGITIYALAHHARRPGYWRSRTDDR